MSEEQSELKIRPSLFAESVYMLSGKKFRLTNRNYLKPIYDSKIEEGLLMCGRQVEKSTTFSVHMANHTIMVPHFQGLYFAPLTDQVSVFSKTRLGKLYEFSQKDFIKKNFMGPHYTNNVFEKQFKNGSVNYLKHCYEYGDNIRGISVNGIWGDEIQDIHIDAIPVIKESQSHALESGAGMKLTWYSGTPKTFANTIQQYWDRSTQNEWVVKCPHCGKNQILGVKNMTPDKYICVKCKMDIPLESRINGQWAPLQRGRKLQGFRISQLMVPWITPQEIWQKQEEYSQDKFYNEVLGRSYENADKPFTAQLLNTISSNNYTLYNRAEREFANTITVMGIDWGKGEKAFTVATIYGWDAQNQRLQLIYTKKFHRGDETDPNKQVDMISALMLTFKIDMCIADWGFGHVQCNTLTKRFGGRFACCYYSFNLKARQKYEPNDNKWVVNRTALIEQYARKMKEMFFVWPGRSRSEMEFLYDHHLAENAEYRANKNGRSEELMYTHNEGSPDDGLHSCVYAFLAWTLASSSRNRGAGIGVINEAGRFNGIDGF